MKTSINIVLLTVALIAVQACSSKSEKEEAAKIPVIAATTATLTPAQRRAAAEEKRAALAEKRKLAWEARVKAASTYKDEEGNLVYNKAEQDPVFNGGEGAMDIYFHDNVKFPEDAEKEGLDGTVYIDFVVASNGRVREVVATSLPDETVDQRFVNEALRVVKAMPNWVPGRQHGKAVSVAFSIPVTFRIAG